MSDTPYDIKLRQGPGPYTFEGTAEGSGGSSPVAAASVLLTDAQIKALPSQGIELVAAQGAGKIVVPLIGVLVSDFAAGEYTGDATDYYTVGTGTDGAELLSPVLRADLTDGGARIMVPNQRTDQSLLAGQLTPVSQDAGQLGGAALTISASASGDFGGGGVGNTLRVAVVYYVLTI